MDSCTQAKASGFSFTLNVLFYVAFSYLMLMLFDLLKFSKNGRSYASYFVSPLAILAVTIWYFRWTKTSVKEKLRQQNCSWKYYLIAVLLQIGLFSLSELNTLFLTWLQKFGYKMPEISLPSMDGWGIVGVLFTVAVLPAVFEEVLFRGMLLDGCRIFGTLGGALVCGGLFALYHQSPAQTIYQFCCGFAFALVAMRAGSVLPTILSHCLNNAIIIFLTKFGVASLNVPVFIVLLCISVPCLIGTLVYLIFFDRAAEKKATGTKKEFFISALGGIAFCAVTWLAMLLGT